MDPAVLAAIIAAGTAAVVNVVTVIVMSNKQTAVIQNEIKHLKEDLKKVEELPERVTRLETKMTAVEDAIHEMRLS